MIEKEIIIDNCRQLLIAYKNGKLGQTIMPEDSNPGFSPAQQEERLVYFTLPMALNYQRDSYKLWQSVLQTYKDKKTKKVFSIKESALLEEQPLREMLLKYKLALQPNKHIATWHKLSKTIHKNWGTVEKMIESVDSDYLKLKQIIQKDYKKDFPYLSGPKIFNYWSFIISTYGMVDLKNREYIEIAPDTHILKCSERLGVITQEEANKLSKEEISQKWRDLFSGSGIDPIDMHAPLWFWSKNGFIFDL